MHCLVHPSSSSASTIPKLVILAIGNFCACFPKYMHGTIRLHVSDPAVCMGSEHWKGFHHLLERVCMDARKKRVWGVGHQVGHQSRKTRLPFLCIHCLFTVVYTTSSGCSKQLQLHSTPRDHQCRHAHARDWSEPPNRVLSISATV